MPTLTLVLEVLLESSSLVPTVASPRSFGMVSTTIWQSDKFNSLERLDARLAYIWLLASGRTCAGVLRVGPAHLYEEASIVETHERSTEIFSELKAANLIDWFKPYVVILGYVNFNPIKSQNHAVAAFREVLALPKGKAKRQLLQILKKQRGARILIEHRDKSGNPHELLFELHAHFEEVGEEEDSALSIRNPSERVSKPLQYPSGTSKTKIENEKVKRSQDARTIRDDTGMTGRANEHTTREGPRPETLALVLKQNKNDC